MSIKQSIKKMVFNVSSALTDTLYRRPYTDPEAKLRLRSDTELLHLDVVITECCSLKCRDCSNLMQYYECPENIASDDIIGDLKKLFECMRVRELKLLGGEPFVNQKALTEVMIYLSDTASESIDMINIITNGTIIPGDECLQAIKNNPKTMITFSNYGKLSPGQNEFAELCSKLGIRYTFIDETYFWLDYGRVIKYDESVAFVRRQYKHCYSRKNCNTLYRGNLYACPRQAHGIRLGLLPDVKDEYVGLHDPQYGSSDELRRAILGLVRRNKEISACHYCLNGKYIHVPRAVQKA